MNSKLLKFKVIRTQPYGWGTTLSFASDDGKSTAKSHFGYLLAKIMLKKRIQLPSKKRNTCAIHLSEHGRNKNQVERISVPVRMAKQISSYILTKSPSTITSSSRKT